MIARRNGQDKSISRPLVLAGQNVLLAYLISEMLPGLLDALGLSDSRHQATESLSSIFLPFFSINWFRHPMVSSSSNTRLKKTDELSMNPERVLKPKPKRGAPQEERDSDERAITRDYL